MYKCLLALIITRKLVIATPYLATCAVRMTALVYKLSRLRFFWKEKVLSLQDTTF